VIPFISPYLYRFRNFVECFFNKLKHFQALATRYEKHDANYLALLKLAAIKIWFRMSRSRRAPVLEALWGIAGDRLGGSKSANPRKSPEIREKNKAV
jgi:hypothetical protein